MLRALTWPLMTEEQLAQLGECANRECAVLLLHSSALLSQQFALTACEVARGAQSSVEHTRVISSTLE
jgi:hypothetical protein